MTWIQKALVAIVTVMTLCAVSYMAGSDAVRNEWDLEKARIAAIALHERDANEANLKSLKKKFKEELEHEKDAAFSAGIRSFLSTNGLLSCRSTVRDTDSGSEAEIPAGVDAAPRESGNLERFAADCVRDARKVEMCAEWAMREGLEVE